MPEPEPLSFSDTAWAVGVGVGCIAPVIGGDLPSPRPRRPLILDIPRDALGAELTAAAGRRPA